MGCQILWIIPCGDFIFIPGNACLQRYSRTWLSCLETVIFLDLTLSFVWWDQSCIYSRFNFPHNPSNILLSTVAGALWITRFFSLGGGHRLYFWPSVACRCCSLWSLQVVLPRSPVVSSHACAERHSVECQRDIPFRSPEFSLHSSLLCSPANSRHLGFPGIPAPSTQLKEIARLCLVSPTPHCTLETNWKQ